MIRLLLVDDQNLICIGLKAVLEAEPDLEVVGIAENGEIAIEQVAALQPNLEGVMHFALRGLQIV